MKLPISGRAARLWALTGVLTLGAGVLLTHNAPGTRTGAGAVQVVDGSESTGKPPKPHSRAILPAAPSLLADGSESTGKPPKPKNA